MKAAFLLVTFLLVVFGINSVASHGVAPAVASTSPPDCSDGWRITGYYTPIETDFTAADTREIEVRGAGKDTFNSEFLRTIFDDDKGYGEGWGKTRYGWYLGYYDGRWHKADAPLDADDKPLKADAVAVDPTVIPAGSTVTIPNLPGDLAKLVFKSTDVGVSVHGKHVDVYTGEGREARRKMWQFTYEDDEDGRGLTKVCFQPPAPAKTQ